MRKVLTIAVAAFFAASVFSPAMAGPMPKPTMSSGVTNVSLPPTKPFKFGLSAPKNQSPKPDQTAAVCHVPGVGWCYVPFYGPCNCCFWNGCWSGWAT